MRTPTLGTIGMLLGALVAGLVAAGPAAAAPSEVKQTWIRAEVVDRHGHPSGQYIDSRREGRTLMVNLDSKFHYLRHIGVDAPNIGLDITFIEPTSGAEWHRESLVTRRSGAFASEPLDLRTLLAPGVPLTVGVHHASGQPTISQDLIEYALLAAFVP